MFYFLCYVKGLATVSLSTMRQSVKTLFLAMTYKVDLVIHLLKCLPNLENLFVQVMILTPNEKLIPCIVQHSLHLKKLVLHFACNGYTICLGMFFIIIIHTSVSREMFDELIGTGVMEFIVHFVLP